MTPLPGAPVLALLPLLERSTQGAWWAAGLATLSVLLATLEYGWANLSRTRLADSGDGPATRERVRTLLAEADRAETGLLVLRSATQMGLVLALIVLAQEWVPRWWPTASPTAPVAAGCGVALVWITLFCRVLPAELSVDALETLVRLTMPAVVVLGRLLSPPIDGFRRLLRVATGSTPAAEAEQYNDEILASVQESEREGHLEGHQADMIEKILSLRNIEVRKLMTPRTVVDTIDASHTVGQARQIAQATGRSRYPVVEGEVDRVVGVLHVKDLLERRADEPVRRFMRSPWFVPQSKFLTELLAEFRKQRTHLAVVLDEYGGTAGVITIEDVLEEIVGEIEDEFDVGEEPPRLHIIDQRHALAPGALRVEEVNAALSISIPESEDWDTLGGFIFSTLGRLPDAGEFVRHDNLVLTVKRVVDRRVDQVAIEILEPVG
jgi:putative hemolysin